MDATFQGIQPWPVNTGHDVIYTWNADMCSTRVIRRPFDSAVTDFQHGFGPIASSFFSAIVPENSVIGAATAADAGPTMPYIQASINESALFFYENGTTPTLDFLNVPRWVGVPATSGAAGYPGQMVQDGTYLYLCTSTNTWKRIALSSF